ncbi:hypothetical protein M9Y10_013782 [Tritrichomonas musculus]|uniref:Uncharacterized protein n=1 Tax=Tritrichomonas musculus TaxID=1915356 RepID=A0ABR2KYM7_9EUKA
MDTGGWLFYWEEATGVLYNYVGTYPVQVSLAEFGEEDQIALKSEIPDDYATKEELNQHAYSKDESDEKYALKSTTGEFRQIDNLNYYTESTFTTTDNGQGKNYSNVGKVSIEGYRFVGHYIDRNTGETVYFDKIWTTDQNLGTTKYCYIVEGNTTNRFMYSTTAGLLYAVEYNNNGSLAHSLNLSAVYKPYDSLLLKSVYEAKIAELEARIASLEAK